MKLQVTGLTVTYGHGGDVLVAVDGVDLSIPTGETLGVVGESGCGKSSLGKAVVGLAPIARGEVAVDGQDYAPKRRQQSREFRRKVQMIFQDPYSSLNPRMLVAESIRDALRTRGITSKARRSAEARRILDMVALPGSALQKYPHEFSGGQRQRIAIARAIAVSPEIIICDEVTSSLDVSVQATILNMLKELQRELGLTYLFISHDLATVRFMSDNAVVMYLGRVVESAKTEALFAAPEHPYTRALMSSIPRVGSITQRTMLSGELPDPRRPPSGCRFHTRCPIGPLTGGIADDRRVCIESDPQAEAGQRLHLAACHFAAKAEMSEEGARA
jgi:peptide/nickel transport system ATP-binding protein